MINRTLFMLISSILLLGSCNKDLTAEMERERLELDRMKTEIKDKIEDVMCNDTSEWEVMALGSKACGGPNEYIAYPKELDSERTDELILDYNRKEEEFNKKYNISSDCMAVAKPSGVSCDGGKPKLIFPY